MARISHFLNLWSYGVVEDIIALRECIVNVKNGENSTFDGESCVDGIEFDEDSSTPPIPFKVFFNDFLLNKEDPSEEFEALVAKFPSVTFIGVGIVDTIESYLGGGFSMFVGFNGEIIDSSTDINVFNCEEDEDPLVAYDAGMKEVVESFTEYFCDWLNNIVHKIDISGLWNDIAFCKVIVQIIHDYSNRFLPLEKKSNWASCVESLEDFKWISKEMLERLKSIQ